MVKSGGEINLSTQIIMTNNTDPEMIRLEKLLDEYAGKARVDINKEKITDYDGRKLFKLIIDDYTKGIVSVDDLSSLCEQMYAKFDSNEHFFDLLLGGAEIEW